MIEIFFPDSPRVRTTEQVTVDEFQPVTVNCLADSNPAPGSNSYRWLNQKNIVKSYMSKLQMDRATKLDSGQYTCRVSVQSMQEYGRLTGSSSTLVTVQCEFIILLIFGVIF